MLLDVKGHIQRVTEMVNKTFDKHCGTGLYMIFHLRDHVVKGFKKSGSLYVLHSSLFERYYNHIKSDYRVTSRQPRRRL